MLGGAGDARRSGGAVGCTGEEETARGADDTLKVNVLETYRLTQTVWLSAADE